MTFRLRLFTKYLTQIDHTTRFEFVVNARKVNALRITIPQVILLQAVRLI